MDCELLKLVGRLSPQKKEGPTGYSLQFFWHTKKDFRYYP